MAPSLLLAQAPESGQRVQLHPLVLLTASDLITRHRLRGIEGPIVGLLLGQQDGTVISAEYAFTAKLNNGLLDQSGDWTNKRIEQFKEVHLKPVLEIVGWFTLCPADGPLPEHAALHKQLTTLYVENGIMLAIHPSEFSDMDGAKGKLPISIYESTSEGESSPSESAMKIDGIDGETRFRAVPFAIHTDETEMIAINYVAKGAGGAAAVSQITQTANRKAEKVSSSTFHIDSPEEGKDALHSRGPELTPEEEDQIAGLTTRLNAIKVLQERIQVMSRLAESVPLSYLSDPTVALSPESPPQDRLVQLRNIQALLSRLSLLTPPGKVEAQNLQQAAQAQANDVKLASILSLLGQDVQGFTELGRKFSTVEQSKALRNKSKGGFGSLDDFSGRAADGLMMM